MLPTNLPQLFFKIILNSKVIFKLSLIKNDSLERNSNRNLVCIPVNNANGNPFPIAKLLHVFIYLIDFVARMG